MKKAIKAGLALAAMALCGVAGVAMRQSASSKVEPLEATELINPAPLHMVPKVHKPDGPQRVKELVSTDLYSADLGNAFNDQPLPDENGNLSTTFSSDSPLLAFLPYFIESKTYAWWPPVPTTYHWTCTVTSSSDLTGIAYIVNYNDGLHALSNEEFSLNADNNYTANVDLTADGIIANPHGFYFQFYEGVEGESIQISNISMTVTTEAELTTPAATVDELAEFGITASDPANYYVSTDGNTKLAFYQDTDGMHWAGVVSTDETITLPDGVFIDGVVQVISNIDDLDWTKASTVKSVYYPNNSVVVFDDFSDSNVTDLYLKTSQTGFNVSLAVDHDFYLHLPYGSSRLPFDSFCTRVLIGDETPEYPSDFDYNTNYLVKDGTDYYGVALYDSSFYITEIFTDKEEVTLPELVPYAYGNSYYVAGAGHPENGYETLTAHAPNLKKVHLPANYSKMYESWGDMGITDLYLYSDEAPYTEYYIPSTVTVHAANKALYASLRANDSYRDANIVPEGWTFEWITVNVETPGEFAEQYLVNNESDWSLGQYVKVTGNINENDLKNMKNLTSLMKLDLTETTITSIPSEFLRNSTTLEEVLLPETMKTIGNNAFYGCSHLRTVNLGGTQNIANYAFYGCSALNNLTASNVAYVGGYAFYECTALAGFDFSKVTYMGNYAFYYTKIEEAVCPELIQAGSYVFNRCTNLVKVEMPKVMVMAEDMFNGCTSLSEVTLNPEITAIPDYTFNNCPALMEFEIPAGVKIIGRYAFARTGLTTVSIPASCTSIGNNAFGYMPNLVEVKCRAAVPPTLNGTIVPDVDMTQCILYVPAFSRDFYRNAEYWSDFFIMRALNEPVESIYVDRALNINLREEDNANVSNNPEIMLTYGMSEDGYYYSGRRGQLTAEGEGTLSAGVLTVTPAIYANATSSSNIYPTLINNADKMRADNVRHTFRFLSSNTWYMISLPYDVAVSSIEPTPDTYWVIRRYNGETRANKGEEYLNGVSAWENLTENDVMEAYKGYIICATRTNNYDQVTGRYLYPELTFESGNSLTKNNIFATSDVAVPLEEHASEFAHNRSWNLVGNPYPSYYNMNMIQDEFTAPVTVYNGSRYNAFSPVDDKLVLAPYQAFFVQRPLDKEAILFGNAGRQHAYEVSEVSGSEEWKEPASLSMEGRNVFNFCINGEQGERARIVLNPEALASYETDRDASKFFANSGVELYVNRDGIRYAIDERPEADGKAVLGVMSDADATCTISLSGRYSSSWNVILRDNLTGIETDLTAKSYEFVATKGDAADRFSVRFERSNDLSGIDEIAAAFAADEKVAVITSDGMKVYEGAFSGFKAEQGVLYIIRAASRTVKAIY